MPSYDPKSPSLRKTEGFGAARHTMRPRKKFSFGRLLGDPFALATTSIAILAWVIAFAGSLISDIQGPFQNYIWWTIAYYFCCIIGVTITVMADAVYSYHVAIVGYLAAGLVMSTSAVNDLIYSSKGSEEAAAAGFILLSMIGIIWIFYFGSQPHSSNRAFVDSFALHKPSPDPRTSRQMSSHHFTQPTAYNRGPQTQSFPNANLQGFEASSPSANFSVGDRQSQARFPPANSQSMLPTASQVGGGDAESEVPPPVSYPYKAKAIYSYEANPDDVNEISFVKHEILEISDVSGRWWQARKQSGETGIAPSNYLILL